MYYESLLTVSGHQLTAARLLDSLQADGSVASGGGDAIAAVSDSELGKCWPQRWTFLTSFFDNLPGFV